MEKQAELMEGALGEIRQQCANRHATRAYGRELRARHAKTSVPSDLLRAAAQVFEESALFEDAKWALEALRTDGNATTADLFSLGSVSMRFENLESLAGRPSTGLLRFREVLERDPDHIAALMNVGHHWLDYVACPAEGRREGLAAFRRVLSHQPELAAAHYGAAMLLIGEGEFREAVDELLTLLRVDPQNRSARLRVRTPELSPLLSATERRLAEARLPEIDSSLLRVDIADTARLVQTFLTHGAVILQNAVSAEAARAIQRDHRSEAARRYSELHSSQWPLDATGAESDAAALLETPELRNAIKAILTRNRPQWTVENHPARHLQWREPTDVVPAPLHQDLPVSFERCDFLTCWLPFTECGDHIAPSLDVFLEPFTDPIRLATQYPTATHPIEPAWLEQYLEDRRWTPAFRPGDALLFGRWLFHRSQVDRAAAGPRMSCDVRYQAGPFAWEQGRKSAGSK